MEDMVYCSSHDEIEQLVNQVGFSYSDIRDLRAPTSSAFRVVSLQNNMLIQALREAIRQRDRAIKDMPHSCLNCIRWQEHAAAGKCRVCMTEKNQWEWRGTLPDEEESWEAEIG